jgi:hypothetical protein
MRGRLRSLSRSHCHDVADRYAMGRSATASSARKQPRLHPPFLDCRRSPSRDLAQRGYHGPITNTVSSLRSEIAPRAARRFAVTDVHSCTSDLSRTRNSWLLVALTYCVEIHANQHALLRGAPSAAAPASNAHLRLDVSGLGRESAQRLLQRRRLWKARSPNADRRVTLY